MVAEEADAGTNAADEVVETSGFARPVETAPVPRKHDARRCVVGEEEIDASSREQRVDVLAGVVPLRVPLEVLRPALIVRGAETATDTTDRDAPRSKVVPLRR